MFKCIYTQEIYKFANFLPGVHVNLLSLGFFKRWVHPQVPNCIYKKPNKENLLTILNELHHLVLLENGYQLLSQWKIVRTLIKKKIKFSSDIRKSEGSGAKPYMANDLLIYGENICAFPHKEALWLCIRSHANFLIYEENFVFFFISEVTSRRNTNMIILNCFRQQNSRMNTFRMKIFLMKKITQNTSDFEIYMFIYCFLVD